MTQLVDYALDGPVATVTLDDGKANALSPAMLAQLGDALDRAEADGATVVLCGRTGCFSGGFDLAVLGRADDAALALARTGFELAARLLSFPAPLVVACTGHAIAMGAFLLLGADLRIGADGPYRISANEVAIGITMPLAAVELMRQRLTPAAFQRAVATAAVFTPAQAVDAGFLDRLAPPAEVAVAAAEAARSLAALDRRAHAASKLRARSHALAAIRAGIDAELAAS